MEYDPKDNEVIHLLKKLKDSNGAYPPEMLSMRRQGYLRQVAEIGAGAGLAMGLRNIAKGGKGTAGLSSSAGSLVELLLVVALVAEAGTVAYFYRDKVTEYFQSINRSPKVEQVASPPVLSSSPVVEMQVTPSPVVTVTESETPTPGTPSGTPSPELVASTVQPKGTDGVGVQSASTSGPSSNTGGPAVSTQAPNGNNGNQYGLTPKPVRTKEPGNDTSSTQSPDTRDKKKP